MLLRHDTGVRVGRRRGVDDLDLLGGRGRRHADHAGVGRQPAVKQSREEGMSVDAEGGGEGGTASPVLCAGAAGQEEVGVCGWVCPCADLAKGGPGRGATRVLSSTVQPWLKGWE